MEMTRPETAGHGGAASTLLLCVCAAASATGFGGLLVTALAAWLLLILLPLARLLRPLPAAVRQGALLLTAAFAASFGWALLTLYAPSLAGRLPALWLTYAAAFACMPAAEEWAVSPPSGGRLCAAAIALPVIGLLRELLAYGTVFAVRVLSGGVSADAAEGGSGVVIAGLLLAAFALRGGERAAAYPLSGASTVLRAALTALAAGVLLWLLRMSWPAFPTEWLPAAAALATALSALPCMYKAGESGGAWLAVAGYTAWLCCRSAAGWQALLWPPVGAAALLVVGCAALALTFRLQADALPAPFRGAPALLTTAGVLWLALAAVI